MRPVARTQLPVGREHTKVRYIDTAIQRRVTVAGLANDQVGGSEVDAADDSAGAVEAFAGQRHADSVAQCRAGSGAGVDPQPVPRAGVVADGHAAFVEAVISVATHEV